MSIDEVKDRWDLLDEHFDEKKKRLGAGEAMEEYRFVLRDENRKKGLYLLGSMRIKGFATEHATEGLYWFNTPEGLSEKKRDLLISATDLKVLM